MLLWWRRRLLRLCWLLAPFVQGRQCGPLSVQPRLSPRGHRAEACQATRSGWAANGSQSRRLAPVRPLKRGAHEGSESRRYLTQIRTSREGGARDERCDPQGVPVPTELTSNRGPARTTTSTRMQCWARWARRDLTLTLTPSPHPKPHPKPRPSPTLSLILIKVESERRAKAAKKFKKAEVTLGPTSATLAQPQPQPQSNPSPAGVVLGRQAQGGDRRTLQEPGPLRGLTPTPTL